MWRPCASAEIDPLELPHQAGDGHAKIDRAVGRSGAHRGLLSGELVGQTDQGRIARRNCEELAVPSPGAPRPAGRAVGLLLPDREWKAELVPGG